MDTQQIQATVHEELAQQRETMIQFLRDLVAIPSYDSQIGPVCEAIGSRMADLGFDEVRYDAMGNILGRVGRGPRTLLYDSHVDTVGVADLAQWQWDPFKGKVRKWHHLWAGRGRREMLHAPNGLRPGNVEEIGPGA